MRVMILGAGGYLGRKVMGRLAGHHDVAGVYRLPPAGPGQATAVGAGMDSIRGALQGGHYDWVVNCAAAYGRNGTPIHELVEANMVFALRALTCAVECGVQKFLTVDTGLPAGFNLYSFTKGQFARFGEFYAREYGTTFINVPLEMFYGEDEPEGRFLSGACRKMVRGEGLWLTAGTQKRDVIHVDDVCDAVLLLLGSKLAGFCNVPLGSGEAVPVRRLLEYMHGVLGSSSRLHFGAVPTRAGEPDCVADTTLLRGIGFEPRYPWRQGLERLCRGIRADELQRGTG